MDSNCRLLESEANALPTEPQPLPEKPLFLQQKISLNFQFMNTEWAQSPDLPTPPRDLSIALYWDTMYNDGDMLDSYPCPWGIPSSPGGT